jgi:tetratricopeptide (TPR) repeat protein
MSHPILFPVIKFGVRQATAFVGHSFLPEDEEIVGKLTEFFGKLGVVCDSGRKAEAVGVSEKVRSRIKESEFFIGIFTRREQTGDGKYTTSSWVIEEKSFALAQGKKVLIFLEKGVDDIGGMQGDLEYIRFDRDNFGDALISAVDYVLSVTSVPLQTSVEGNKINITIKNPMSVEDQLKKLRDASNAAPNDIGLIIGIANILESQGDVMTATKELEGAREKFQQSPELIHHLGHFYERHGNIKKALGDYHRSLELNSANGKFYFCYAKCLYKKTTNIEKMSAKKPILEKCSRYLDRAYALADQSIKQEIEGFRFIIDETLRVSKSTKASEDD